MTSQTDRLRRHVVPLLTSIGTTIVAALERGPFGTVRRVGVGLVRETLDDDVMGLSAELAYRWLLALFPLAIMVAAISGFAAQALGIQDPSDQLIEAAGQSLPPDAASVIRPQLERIFSGGDGALLSLGLVLTIYAASSGIRALIKGLNRAYDIDETRPLWRQYAIALSLTVSFGVAVVASFVVLVTGQVAARDVAAAVGLAETTSWLFELAPIPLAVVALGLASGLLYWAAPARRLGWRWVLPGVALFVPGWVAATVGLSFYVSEFASYDDTYGALGGVIVLLLWLYMTALILLLGGEFNAVIGRELDDGHDRDHDQPEPRQPEGSAR